MAARPSGRNRVLDAITVKILTRLAGSMAMTSVLSAAYIAVGIIMPFTSGRPATPVSYLLIVMRRSRCTERVVHEVVLLAKVPHVTKIFGARVRRRHERSAWLLYLAIDYPVPIARIDRRLDEGDTVQENSGL
jgi:hypothetical protein